MKVLITGASGFIGRNLVEHLGQHHEVAAPSRTELDLLNELAVRNYVETNRFDAVIHAAAEGVSRRVSASGSAIFTHNCRMFFNLARNVHAFGRMLFFSSGAVYDRAHANKGVGENDFDAHVPQDDYGFSKYVCAKAIEAMEGVYELRLFGLFGRYEDWQVRFVSNTCCRALWNLPIVIRRNTCFDYLDVEDLGRIVDCCLEKKLNYRQYNVCRGMSFELKALAEKIVTLSGREVPVSVEAEDLVNEYSGDNSRLLREFPDLKFREIDDSLNRLYQWYEARKSGIDPSLLRFDG